MQVLHREDWVVGLENTAVVGLALPHLGIRAVRSDLSSEAGYHISRALRDLQSRAPLLQLRTNNEVCDGQPFSH